MISIGQPGNVALEVALDLEKNAGISLAHFDLRFLKPLDEDLLHHAFRHFQTVITIEDNALAGGMGSLVLEFMADHGYRATVRRLGIPDAFIEQGTLDELHAECGYDAAGLRKAILGECEIFVKPKNLQPH